MALAAVELHTPQEVRDHARVVHARIVSQYEKPRSYWQNQCDVLTNQLEQSRTQCQATQAELETIRAEYLTLLARCNEPLSAGPVDIEKIQRVVCGFYKVARIDMIADRRKGPVVRARHIAMFISRTLTQQSLPAIGRMFGDRDHSTVHHALTKLESERITDGKLDAEIKLLIERIVGKS